MSASFACVPASHRLSPRPAAYALPFSCGFGGVVEGDWGEGTRAYFVDGDLRRAFDAEFDEIGGFSQGLAAFRDGDDAGYLDTSGRPRLILPYQALREFNAHGFAIANRDEDEWDIDIIDRQGQPRLCHLSTADFWPGDFPHFEVTVDGKDQWYDLDFSPIFES